MKKRILWHGSPIVVERPNLAKGKAHNDYGRGFYCTENPEMAKEWACVMPSQNGYANRYELNCTGLSVLNLSDDKFHVLNWLAILAMHRDFRTSTPVGIEGKEYLIREFAIDITSYDIIKGYRADDSYFAFARAFVNNMITVEQLAKAMKLGGLGEQIVLKSEKSFEHLHFLGKEYAEGAMYFAKRESRNRIAEQSFRKIMTGRDNKGLYMADILREEIKNEDTRLR